MSANDRRTLENIVNRIRKDRFPEMSLEDYFEFFSAEQITKDYSLTDEEILSGIVDGEHDGGIDAVYVFVNGDLIGEDPEVTGYKQNIKIDLIIVQSKSTGGFSEEPINKMNSSLGHLLDLDADFEQLSQYSSPVKNALDVFRKTYSELANKFPSLSIQMHYAAMNASSGIHKNLGLKRDEIVAKVKTKFHDASVSFAFSGAPELLALARKQPNQTFNLGFVGVVPADNGYVALSYLRDYNRFLRNGEEKVRHDLFDANVRDYQGSTEVNSEMGRTLTGQREVDFWWLNNGVTILANKATQAGNNVVIENPLIVNGLQTSFQIARYFDEGGGDDNRMVMVKIVSQEDEAVRDQIIKATNSQNVVPSASLRATDKVQRDIEDALKIGGYYYDRRKNYYKNQGRPAAKIVSIPLLAQAMMSLLRAEPNNARARPSSLIKDDQVYGSLFSEKHPVGCYLSAADLIKRIEAALKTRATFSAADRNNLRFYCLFWVAGWAVKSTSLTARKVADLRDKDKVKDTDIKQAIDRVGTEFRKAGGTDKVAKGSEFKDKLISKLEKEIKDHFSS